MGAKSLTKFLLVPAPLFDHPLQTFTRFVGRTVTQSPANGSQLLSPIAVYALSDNPASCEMKGVGSEFKADFSDADGVSS